MKRLRPEIKRRILVDGRIFSLQTKGGISQLWAYIITSKAWQNVFEVDLFVYPGYEKNLHLLESLKSYESTHINFIKSDIPPSDNSNFSSEEDAKKRLTRLNASLLEEPKYVINTYYGENIFPKCKNYMVTALDFAHEELPELSSKPTTAGVIKRKKIAFSQTSLLVFISNTSRAHFFKHYKSLEDLETRVVYLGHSEDNPPVGKADASIIHVGTRSSYKNFQIVFDALKVVMSNNSKVVFLILGGEAEDNYIRDLKELFPERVFHANGLSDQEMDLFMKMSSIYVSASMYEGFGIPLLNALRFGSIPVVSDIPVYREVAGKHGIYFDFKSSKALVEALSDALDQFPLHYASFANSYERTWESVAQDYVNLIH